MLEGTIIKGIAGFYYVSTSEGVFECKARGKFRIDNITPIVGDNVIVQVIDKNDFTGSVYKILPRKNELIRPKVANIDQVIIVFAATKPEINFDLLDRFILLVEKQNIEIVICINKIDIDDNNTLEKVKQIYVNAGYPIIATSTKSEIGIDKLKDYLINKVTAFAGPSGVGKSSLLNKVEPTLDFKTGEISTKISRGKHTTRHAELVKLNLGGYIVDSPGFTSLHINDIEQEDLQYYFKEFQPFIGKCKFNPCSHTHEPDCAILNQVNKTIPKQRYECYKTIYEQLQLQRKNKYN